MSGQREPAFKLPLRIVHTETEEGHRFAELRDATNRLLVDFELADEPDFSALAHCANTHVGLVAACKEADLALRLAMQLISKIGATKQFIEDCQSRGIQDGIGKRIHQTLAAAEPSP